MKKLNQLINKLVKRDKSVNILIVEDNDQDLLHVGLGISNNRIKELDDLAYSYFKTGKQNVNNLTALVEISKQCKHPNELGICCLRYGRYLESSSRNYSVKFL